MKRGQGLPITTIIIAILCLTVLVVIMFVFTGRISIWGGEIAKCPGVCRSDGCPSTYAPQPGKYAKDVSGTDCKVTGPPEKFMSCCIPILKLSIGEKCSAGIECDSGTCTSNKCT